MLEVSSLFDTNSRIMQLVKIFHGAICALTAILWDTVTIIEHRFLQNLFYSSLTVFSSLICPYAACDQNTCLVALFGRSALESLRYATR